MHGVSTVRQRVRQLGGHDAAAADRGVTHHADVHGRCFSSPDRTTGSRTTMPFGKRDARERAELRVAALDQLSERRRGQPRLDRAIGRRA